MKGNKIKLITKILAILIISLVSFVGIYTQSANKMVNRVKGYEFSKDLKGYREVTFKVSEATEVLDKDGKVIGDTDIYTDESIESNSYQKTENKVNAEESLTTENYKECKKIVEKRLEELKVSDYTLSLDEESGLIHLILPEEESTTHTISNLLQVSNFEIRDSEDASKIFLTNEDLKKVSAVYGSTTSGTTVYLQFEFNKEGKRKLNELSTGEYATKKEEDKEESTESEEKQEPEADAEVEVSSEENNENNSQEESESEEASENKEEEKKDEQKKVILAIDSNEMITTSFDDPIKDGIIDLSMGSASKDTDTINNSIKSASTIGIVLNSGKMPLTYKIEESQYVQSDISKEDIKNVVYVISGVVAIALVILIIKNKFRGIIAAIAYIGFVALDLLLVRYTNVVISIESIVSTIVVLGINYLFVWELLKVNEADNELKKALYTKKFTSLIIKLIPIFIIAIVFSFVSLLKASSFGMVMFWGILLSVIYNYVLTKRMID